MRSQIRRAARRMARGNRTADSLPATVNAGVEVKIGQRKRVLASASTLLSLASYFHQRLSSILVGVAAVVTERTGCAAQLCHHR